MLNVLEYIDVVILSFLLLRSLIVYHGYKVKLVTLVEGDPEASFSIATIPRCRGGCYFIPWIAPLYP